MDALIFVLIVTLALLAFNLAVRFWGVSSIDDFESAEWERRKQWRGFGG